MGLRLPTETFTYDDPGHPDRPTGVIHSPPYVSEDRALIAALGQYEKTLCPGGCQQPREIAWHSDMDGGWFEVDKYVCHACTARRGETVTFVVARNTRDLAEKPLTPFVLHEHRVTDG